ncbi:MAG: hypothetical protein ACR2J6_07595 [Thermoleophilaceae bacterium]
MSARPLFAGAAVSACLLAGCGGADSEQDAQQVVKDFPTAVNERDGKKFCTELTTRAYLERVTATMGDASIRQCEQQIDSLRLQQKYKVVKFAKTKIDGDTATVTAVLELQGKRRPQVFRLRRQDGEFRLTSGTTD